MGSSSSKKSNKPKSKKIIFEDKDSERRFNDWKFKTAFLKAGFEWSEDDDYPKT